MGINSTHLKALTINILKTISLILIFTPQISYADFKDFKCTFLLAESEMYEFSSYKECPSGTTGLGKPWRWDTYKFNSKADPTSPTKLIRIDEESCTGRKDFHPGMVTFSPLLIRIRYLDNLGHYSSRELTIHKDTLIGIDGEYCEYIEEPIIKN